MSINLLQQLNSIPNLGGTGLPVQQYASEMQQVLTAQFETIPNSELSTLSTTQNALNSLQPALQQLQSATQTLASSLSWNAVHLTTTGSGFTATAQAGAEPSSYTIQVNNLATAQWNTASVSLATSTGSSTLTAGTFAITPSSTSQLTGTATITVTSGESLSDIAAAVNQDSAATGVVASIIQSNNGYQLTFQDVNPGATNTFSLTDVSGNVISSQLKVTQTATATDASITLDGSMTLTSSSDTFANAIPNVTINVNQAGASGTILLAQDSSAALSAVQNWMNAYNSVISTLHTDTAYTPASASNPAAGAQTGPLFTDPAATGLLAQLPNSVNSFIGASGATGSSNFYHSLSQLGIVVDPNTGQLEFQSASGFAANPASGTAGFSGTLQSGQAMFTHAVQSNLAAVQQLFGVVQTSSLSSEVPTNGILGNLNTVLNEFLGSGSSTGVISGELQSISQQQKEINQYLKQVNQMITNNVQNFTSQLNNLNASLQQSSAQMQQINAMLNGASSSSSSSSSNSSGG
ncbi:flagellar filament capping protein FliD [Sulfoacidibacillus thermotolerans]|uniref:Flagellar hook-associated protein 2 n=1 Tax=Sulfoacidibacillus thermotolerans TaxID=1765684 RepID=A0A2U3D7N2_SULT2|nr:flagellar filament capping protein FliD [Sulfoacidibacillus thermotolerans]PWI57278.1 hypothetical protein BM613_09275 [Sulfoacidibacillus thermotolerans]